MLEWTIGRVRRAVLSTPVYIKSCISNGLFTLTEHASQRMYQRRVMEADIREAAKSGIVSWSSAHNSWNLVGTTLDGDTLVVACDDKAPIIGVSIRTVYWKDKENQDA